MQKNSLTLCMIVRDEEETIGRAIKSALAVVDEVVVVDTGSTDNTRLIVEGYGARVVDFPWNDDFSAARNAGLAAAYGDWILVLDADEVLESIRPVEMGRLLADEEAVAYYARIRNEVPGCAPTVYDKVRIFRNHPDIRYRYPIHEQVTPAIANLAARTGRKFLPSPVSIVHYGSPEQEEKGKKARNQRLLQRAIEQYPEEPYFHYQIACEMSVHLADQVLPVRGFEQMLSELERATDLVRAMDARRRMHLGYGADLFARTAAAQLVAGRPEDALAVCEEGIEAFGDSSLLRFTHGTVLLAAASRCRRARRARELRSRGVARMEEMIAHDDAIEPAPISRAYFETYPLRHLGLAALEEGDVDKARVCFRRALEADPDYTGALCGLAQVAVHEGRVKEGLQIYLKALSIDEAEVTAWMGGIEVLLQLGFEDNARSWLRKLAHYLPEHPRLRELTKTLEDAALVATDAEAGVWV